MEKKRKLPARAAARHEQAAKRRSLANREASPAVTPAPAPSASSRPVREPTPPPPPLPTSIQVGKPLPTVQDAQLEDLSIKEYQSISESGVMAESLSRSRTKWVSDGLFEKYWTKPYKRKGVLHEDPNNPSKDSMIKIGSVTITIEPHIIEATMYTVKASKPNVPLSSTPSQSQSQQPPKQMNQPRPILQYGPPTGSMPPPPTPTSTAANTPKLANAPSPATNPSQASPAPVSRQQVAPPLAEPVTLPSPAVAAATTASASPTPASRPPPSQSPVPHAIAPQTLLNRQPSSQAHPQASTFPLASATRLSSGTPSTTPATSTIGTKPPAPAPGPIQAPAPTPAPASAKPAANDPVIALLAQRASGDPELRDLMKRVAMGQAKNGELAQFQRIIDMLNHEYKHSGDQPSLPPDKLYVDGRTVKYYADEVRTILNIVLASNPQQKSSDLRPPPGSNPLVVLLVKTALEDSRTRDTIRRIAEDRQGPNDAQDLKDTLDRLHRDAKIVPKSSASSSRPSPTVSQGKQQVPNGVPNGHVKSSISQQHQTPQALRSKGPPPAQRPDISAVVFDFGTGDRYLFPKYSILEFSPMSLGQQVVASFLIVRKGSMSEYGGDPALDYYQPVTIRLQTASGRHLENLTRVVAPQDEVQRYMNDVMDNMTRAEYVLLAMRLPRMEQNGEQEASSGGGGGASAVAAVEDQGKKGSTARIDIEADHRNQASKPGVLWTSGPTNLSAGLTDTVKYQDAAEHSQVKYERLIRSVAERETESAV
ncbi:hypothetical protein CDD81_6320 [Ophiocordyceps australis]|uniref:SWR1-complex protein 3 domain-containing protein n=1 Tax=Ophiocordyceps australis TaxID=1399860 RepID=A0A2C5Y0Q8_9HYPO|nr:hypothetical protein CDD81_6320 [Ophiocordyceps australis]